MKNVHHTEFKEAAAAASYNSADAQAVIKNATGQSVTV